MRRNRHRQALAFIRAPRGSQVLERVCIPCKIALGTRWTCPQCGGPTELKTLTKTGPMTAAAKTE